jgi:hypothetical protein
METSKEHNVVDQDSVGDSDRVLPDHLERKEIKEDATCFSGLVYECGHLRWHLS